MSPESVLGFGTTTCIKQNANPATSTGSPYTAFMTILQAACTYFIIKYT